MSAAAAETNTDGVGSWMLTGRKKPRPWWDALENRSFWEVHRFDTSTTLKAFSERGFRCVKNACAIAR